MSSGYLLRRAVGHHLLARVSGQRVVALFAVADDALGAAGNVYVGRVVRVVDALSAAFVDYGGERPGFLPASELPGDGVPSVQLLRRQVAQGQWIVVQIQREASAQKGAKVTMRVTLPGRYCVLTAHRQHLAVSQKVTDSAVRERLASQLQPTVDAAAASGCPVALVVRTAAEAAPAELVAAEAEALLAKWRALLQRAAPMRKAAQLSATLPPVAALLAAIVQPGESTLFVDDLPAGRLLLAALAAQMLPAASLALRPFADWAQSMGEQHVRLALQKALAPRVHLADGGSLVIQQTEALCAIDVNSGQRTGAGSKFGGPPADTLRALNLAAARAAGEQIVLRNLGGLIVIDFVDVADAAHRADVVQVLESALAGGGERSYVTRMSELGLVQLTRRQRVASLASKTRQPCPRCRGEGSEPAAWYVASHLLWAADAHLATQPETLLLCNCAPEVAACLQGVGHELAALLARRHGCQLVPVARSLFGRGQFELLPGGANAGTVVPGAVC